MLRYGNLSPDAALVILYGNCQAPYLALQLALADARPDGLGYLCVLNHTEPGGVIERPTPRELARCVLYLEQYEYRTSFDTRAELRQALGPGCPRLTFPPLVMYAPWPFDAQESRLPPDEQYVWGRYPMGDSVGQEVAAMGLNPEDVMAAYRKRAREKMPDLQARLDLDIARMEERDSVCDVVIADYVRAHFRERHLFWTTAHVSVELIAEMGKRLYRACLPVLGGDFDSGVERIRHGLAGIDGMGEIQVPIDAEVAQTLGLKFHSADMRYRWYDQQWTFDEYMRRYITCDTRW